MTDEERRHFSNLLYLCPKHADLIDQDPVAYPVRALQDMKRAHEDAWNATVRAQASAMTFDELEIVCEGVQGQALPTDDDLTVVDPSEKMRRNGLTERIQPLLVMGLAASVRVREFIQDEALRDADFPARLRVGFMSAYLDLRKQGVRGDELFEQMCDFACGSRFAPARCAAGLAVLAHLFEACEVFERDPTH